ncbi:hypothetical protein ACLOJK_023740 [Asimina triloba]
MTTLSADADLISLSNETGWKTAVYLSPPIPLSPGSVSNRLYYNIDFPRGHNIDFPRGHIALKSFNGELVDESGKPIPLTDTYLHHWVVYSYFGHISNPTPYTTDDFLDTENIIPVRNDGFCQEDTLRHIFGLGSETRATLTDIPDPYGLEAGNPDEAPDGYEQRWVVNIHEIDTRGVVNPNGCAECWCNLFNVTRDDHDRDHHVTGRSTNNISIPGEYKGGTLCCYTNTRCAVREGFEDDEGLMRRVVYMRYTVKWVEWDESSNSSTVVGVRSYIMDATDNGERVPGNDNIGCQVEYDVDQTCGAGVVDGGCIDTRTATGRIGRGGNIIYGLGHLHMGGLGIALYGQDGRLICESLPVYGRGKEVGNENGYVVGMSTCYPRPGSVSVADGEILRVVANYSSAVCHTGVMSHFYILVDQSRTAVNALPS